MPLDARRSAIIHVAKKQLALHEDDYRSILRAQGGVASARDLDAKGFNRVMRRFEELGFDSTSKAKPVPERCGMASPEQTSLMRYLWSEFTHGEGTDASFGKWLESHFRLSSITFINARTAPKVITALRAMVKKRAKPEAA